MANLPSTRGKFTVRIFTIQQLQSLHIYYNIDFSVNGLRTGG